ncbi:hypothetical protein ACFU7Y_08640 [Kitasatospora sp. NPDC057542]|uniref:hypothetical protein n=1 Tax=Kitasatospora sp. NPDC057542 TaxID=3346162 RepID=UPI003685D20E
MYPDWWTEQDRWAGSPWLRIPQEERAVEEEDPIGRQVEEEFTSIGPSWQVGHTLYTLVDHDAATGTRALYALRSSGALHRLLEGAHPEHLYGAWLLLTSPSAPDEPLGQLAFEYLLEESYTTAAPLEILDTIERRRYLQARDLDAWGREQGIVPTSPDPDPDIPDSLRLEAQTAHERATVERWLHALEDELDLPTIPEQPDPRPADPALEDAFNLQPPAGWTPEPLATGNDNDNWPDAVATAPRPHSHRGDDDLTRALLRAEWAMWQANQRACAASFGASRLRVEALFGRGPQSTALERHRHRLATAAGWMRQAQDTDANRARIAQDAACCRQEAAAFDAQALRPWWSVVLRGDWPPTHRGWLHECAEAERVHAQALDTLAGEYGEDVLRYLDEARRAAPESRDPLGDADLLEEALPRLKEEAVAADCLTATQRSEALRREEQSARSLWQWHWYAAWHIRQEIRQRRRAAGRRPMPSVEDFAGPVAEDLRYCERPLSPWPGSDTLPEDGDPQ